MDASAITKQSLCQYPDREFVDFHICCVLIRKTKALYPWISENKQKEINVQLLKQLTFNSVLNHFVSPSCLILSNVYRIRCTLDHLEYSVIYSNVECI